MIAPMRRDQGHELLLDALEALPDGLPLAVALAGDGPLRPWLESRVDASPDLVDRVRFVHRHQEPASPARGGRPRAAHRPRGRGADRAAARDGCRSADRGHPGRRRAGDRHRGHRRAGTARRRSRSPTRSSPSPRTTPAASGSAPRRGPASWRSTRPSDGRGGCARCTRTCWVNRSTVDCSGRPHCITVLHSNPLRVRSSTVPFAAPRQPTCRRSPLADGRAFGMHYSDGRPRRRAAARSTRTGSCSRATTTTPSSASPAISRSM